MTIVEQIFKMWQTTSRGNFDEYMLNNCETLLREEKEQIVDSYIAGWEAQPFLEENQAENYYNENIKN